VTAAPQSLACSAPADPSAHYGRIAAYVASLVRDPGEAEELTQEVFLRAHRRRDSLRDPDALLPWLYAIATRVCLDRLRQRAARPSADGELDPDTLPSGDRDAAPELRAAQGEMSECVQGHVAELGDRYRAVLLLHDGQGLTLNEIAELLGISSGAAKMRLHRARRWLEESLRAGCDFSRDERGVVVCEPKP
jgi:RNA polymerase sigma-70 factor (ECF subfamily)